MSGGGIEKQFLEDAILPAPEVQRPRRQGARAGGGGGPLRLRGRRIQQHCGRDEARLRQHAVPLDELSDDRRREGRPPPRHRVRDRPGGHAGVHPGTVGERLAAPLRSARNAFAGGPFADRDDPRRTAHRPAGDPASAHALRLPRRADRFSGAALRGSALAVPLDPEGPVERVRRRDERAALSDEAGGIPDEVSNLSRRARLLDELGPRGRAASFRTPAAPRPATPSSRPSSSVRSPCETTSAPCIRRSRPPRARRRPSTTRA